MDSGMHNLEAARSVESLAASVPRLSVGLHRRPQASLAHYEAAEQAWDQGSYGTAVVEGAESVGTIVGRLAESAWDAISGSGDDK
jgi:hypothetical protein